MNNVHEANRRYWNEAAGWWESLEEEGGLWQRCPSEPDLAFTGGALGLVRGVAGTLSGKDVCVVGSGDNHAAFALAGMGANLTSVDISERRLAVASKRARHLGLPINVRAGRCRRPESYRERGVRPGILLPRVLRLDCRPASGVQRDMPYPASRRPLRLLRHPPRSRDPGKTRSCRLRLRSHIGKPGPSTNEEGSLRLSSTGLLRTFSTPWRPPDSS